MSTLAAQLLRSYNFGAVQLIVGGAPVGGFDDDGGIEFENPDLFEKTVGADGQVTYSVINDDSLGVTITLKETSAGVLVLNGLLQIQIAAVSLTGSIPPLPFVMFDPATGDSIVSAFAVFMGRPNLNKGRVAGAREFRMDLVGSGATQQAGAGNLI